MLTRQHLQTARQLFTTDWMVFRPLLRDKFIDASIWVICSIFVNAYLLPKLGISASYGMLAFAGIVASAGLFEGYTTVITVLGDLLSDKTLYYYATLPLPSWLMIFRLMLSHACLYIIMTLAYLPLGKLMLYDSFDLSIVSWYKLIILVVVSNIFYGAFSVFTASFVYGFEHMGSVWARFIFPLWFLGGFAFSWAVLFEATPWFAYIDLMNPILYISEGYRSVLMGPGDFINFWLCIGMICLFAVGTGWIGIRRLKSRCDFI